MEGVASRAQSAVRSEPNAGRLRLDIEGLRAVAVLSVLAYHASVPFLPGGFVGVDIFFVISGFLITGLLVREAEKSGRISISNFYARRAKRLLPAASLVLLFTSVGTWALYAGSEARAFGGDIVAAASYLVNWRFAARAVDYLAEGTGDSPVLHFWSLAVEEQYYIVWPLLAILAVLLARKFGWTSRATMSVGLALIAFPSFAYAIYATQVDAARSFFVTPTRMWELAAGAAVALAAPHLNKIPRVVAHALAWVGATAIAASLFVISDATPWPGAMTLLPVLGAAAVIAAGFAHQRTVPALLLSLRPMVWVGALSYSLYLWHWPILVFAEQYFGDLRIFQKCLLAAAALIPAYLSLRLIENPVRRSPALARDAKFALTLGAALTLLGVAAGFGVMALKGSGGSTTEVVISASAGEADGAEGTQLWGAQVLGDDPLDSPLGDPTIVPETIVPDPLVAREDIPSAYDLGCQGQPGDVIPKYCPVGDLDGEVRIVAVGDSKLLQYYDALDAIGKERGWRVEVATKSACSWADTLQDINDVAAKDCQEFSEQVLADIEANPPDFVLTSGSPFIIWGESKTSNEQRAEALASNWIAAENAGATVIALLEPPRSTLGGQNYECVDLNRADPELCSYSRDKGVKASTAPSQVLAAQMAPGTAVVSVSDYVCPQTMCAPVIGDVLVLRQGSHMTNTYALTLAAALGERLSRVIDGGEKSVGPTFLGS